MLSTKDITSSTPRGTIVRAPGGSVGRFVGVQSAPNIVGRCVWVAWDEADFQRMCAAFDATVRAQ